MPNQIGGIPFVNPIFLPHQRSFCSLSTAAMGNRTPSVAKNPWSRARIHLPPRFTTQTSVEIASRFDVETRVGSCRCCPPTAAVQDLLIELSSGKQSSRLYEALVLLYDKKVRIESDPSLMQVTIIIAHKMILFIYFYD